MVEVKEDGTHPGKTAGALRVNRDDLYSVGLFRMFYEEQRNAFGTQVPPFWDRPFDEVLADPEVHDKYLLNAIPRDCPGRGKACGMFTGPLGFRGKVIAYMEGLPEALADRAYEDMTPEQAIEYAGQLKEVREIVADDERAMLDAAASWLDYWGAQGHPIYAWY